MSDASKAKLSDDEIKTAKIELNVPEEHRHGLYANYLLVSFSQYEFRLHFAYLNHPKKDGDNAIADVVAKINIPVEMMPGLIHALQENFSKFSKLKGSIKGKNGEQDE